MENIRNTRGTVFDIEHFSIHDGSGIRAVVFLKGCPLHCAWCANPESNRKGPQIGFFADKCSFCQRCVSVCPRGDIFAAERRVDWEHCVNCFHCIEACNYGARVVYGKEMTAEEVLAEVRRDMVFFRNSGGGVTLSGGEVCMQVEFTSAILTLLQQEGIHTAIETSGFCSSENYKRIVSHVDQLLMDFKCMDSEQHRRFVGVPNEQILENAILASEIVPEMIVRWPIIPGFNDSLENARALADFITEYMPRVKRADLLPYHTAGKSKCEHIGQKYSYDAPYELENIKVEELQRVLLDKGIDARIGG